MKHYVYDQQERIHYAHYDSITDLQLEPVYDEKSWSAYMDRSHNNTHDYPPMQWWGWHGGYHRMKDLMENGWPEGAKMARESLTSIQLPRMRSSRRRRVRGAMGNELDIHRVYSGQLDTAWDTMRREATEHSGQFNAVLVVHTQTESSVRSYEAFWRGAAAALIADLIQQSGRGVQVVLNISLDYLSTQDDSKSCISLTLKDFGEPMDLERLIVGTSVGFYRGELFRAKHCMTFPVRYGFGYIRSNPIYPLHIQGANTYLVEVPHNIYSRGSAQDLVNKVAKELGMEEGA